MAKIPIDYEFGDSVIVVLRTTVQALVAGDGYTEVVTDHGAYNSDDEALIAVFPDPDED
jgi:hypothetical protein